MKKQKIQKNRNYFILIQMAIFFSKLKIFQNDLLHSFVDFNTLPKWAFNHPSPVADAMAVRSVKF